MPRPPTPVLADGPIRATPFGTSYHLTAAPGSPSAAPYVRQRGCRPGIIRHVWTAPPEGAGFLWFGRWFGRMVGCGHVSGLCARCPRPLAPEVRGSGPDQISALGQRFDGCGLGRSRLDRGAITSKATLAPRSPQGVVVHAASRYASPRAKRAQTMRKPSCWPGPPPRPCVASRARAC